MKSCWWKGAYPGVEMRLAPGEVGVVDVGDVVEGLVLYGLRRVRRVRRGSSGLRSFLHVDT